jgi:ABC-2 type transport system permease protein
MNKILQVFRYELLRNVRRRGFLLTTFGLPLLALVGVLGFHLFQQSRVEEEPQQPFGGITFEFIDQAGYVDYSGYFSEVPDDLANLLTIYADEEAARAALEDETIDVFYVIAEDYLETGEVILHMPNMRIDLINVGPFEELFYRTFAGDLDRATITRLRNPANFQEFNLERTEAAIDESSEGLEFGVIYAAAILLLLGLTFTNSYLMQTVVEEKETRLIEILISAMRPTQLLAGKVLALGLLGISQILIWLVSGILIFNVAAGLSTYAPILGAANFSLSLELIPLILVFFVLLYFFYAAIFGAIGAMSGSVQEGAQYVGLLAIPTILPFYFLPLFQADPSGVAPTVMSFIPITAPLAITIRTMLASVPLWQTALSLLLMLLSIAGAIWMAGRVFRVQTLLAGQSVSLRELPRLLFGGDGRKSAADTA